MSITVAVLFHAFAVLLTISCTLFFIGHLDVCLLVSLLPTGYAVLQWHMIKDVDNGCVFQLRKLLPCYRSRESFLAITRMYLKFEKFTRNFYQLLLGFYYMSNFNFVLLVYESDSGYYVCLLDIKIHPFNFSILYISFSLFDYWNIHCYHLRMNIRDLANTCL